MSCSLHEFFLLISSLNFIMFLRLLILLFFLFSFAAASSSDDHHLPRPLILQYPEKAATTGLSEQTPSFEQTHSSKAPDFNENDPNKRDAHSIENPNFNHDEQLNQHTQLIENPVSLHNELNQHTQLIEKSDFNHIELNQHTQSSENPSLKDNEQQQLECTSWRFAVEANNLSPWKTVPSECAEYVKEYITGKGYGLDLERVSSEAGVYARSVVLGSDGRDAWIFDIDETLLSNLPYYADHGYG